MQTINRNEVLKMMDERRDLALIEVVSPEYYQKFHLPKAKDVPLGDDFEVRIQEAAPDKETPAILCCQDRECPSSSEAAQRMDKPGYRAIYDYEAGKPDWKDSGLAIES
jgi:rhodanese-related sulfurtransferase